MHVCRTRISTVNILAAPFIHVNTLTTRELERATKLENQTTHRFIAY